MPDFCFDPVNATETKTFQSLPCLITLLNPIYPENELKVHSEGSDWAPNKQRIASSSFHYLRERVRGHLSVSAFQISGRHSVNIYHFNNKHLWSSSIGYLCRSSLPFPLFFISFPSTILPLSANPTEPLQAVFGPHPLISFSLMIGPKDLFDYLYSFVTSFIPDE